MTAPITVPVLAATRLARRLTAPFGRGADTLTPHLRPVSGSVATVDAYDFAEHSARFGRAPEPRYVLAVERDIAVATTVTVTYTEPGVAPVTVTVKAPAGTPAGTSFALNLPVSATGRISQLAMVPAVSDGRPDLRWSLTALLGNTAKLLWVIGAERDVLRRQIARTVAQRHLPTAVGPSLDLIGIDLGVPRFPPLSYGFDTETVALYHLDDVAGANPAVADLTAAYPGRTGHPGVIVGPVEVGVAGRYGQAMGFRAAGAAISVASSPGFDVAANASATVECFVRPDSGAADGPVVSRHLAPGGPGAGWVLAVGEFGRGLPRNVRLTIGDGTRVVEAFADVSLPTDAFTHVAGVLDRAGGRVALYVDGVLSASQPLGALGAVTNTAPLRIGAAAGGFRGVVDEVRISSAARSGFAPALGEADEHYRRRLRLFRRWTLPTPANLAAMLNELVGPIAGQPDALVVDDTNAAMVRGTRLVRVRPATLLPGESIDAAGRRRVTEAEAVGTAQEEDSFDPAYLIRHDRPDVDYTTPPPRDLRPGERPADPRLLQLGVVERLDRLVTLAGAEDDPPGRLSVESGFDPRAGDLRATGRAVLLGHSSVPPDRLAALAHRAGFDFVRHRSGAGDGRVYAASARADYFAIKLTPSGNGPTNLDVGATVALSLHPTPPPDAFLHWLVVPGKAGQGVLTPNGAQGTPQHTATLRGVAGGPLIVKVDVTRGRHTVSATRRMRVGLTDLANGATIAADGTLGLPPAFVDRPGKFFHQAFLIRHDDSRVDYGSENAHRMQPAVGELLDVLLAELARRAVTGRLVVAAALDPAGDLSAIEGRRLVLRHSTLAAGPLAAAAFAVGFGHIQRTGTDVLVRQAPGQLVTVRGPVGLDAGSIIELEEGSGIDLTASPAPTALRTAGVPGPVAGEGPRLAWASGTFDAARIALGSSTQPSLRLTAETAGMAWVQASYLIGGAPVPYTFQVRLRPGLDTPATVITKDQFDLIMNILNALHPVGVEVITAAIRERVVEVRGDLLNANPDYTYPKFRVRGALPRQVKRSAHG